MATRTRPPRQVLPAAAEPLTLPALEPVTVAKLEQAALLIERLIAEKTSVFADHANRYRSEWRAASERVLSAEETAAVAAAMAEGLGHPDPIELAERLQGSKLRAQDEPARGEILLAAGAATAPAFLDAALRVVALIEMPGVTFEHARETATLDAAIDAASDELRKLGIKDARSRAERAFLHFSDEAGLDAGEAMGLVGRMIGEALTLAVNRTVASSSLTGSPPSTAGPDETVSTARDGETP